MKIRIVVFKDEDQFVAQALEHDICVQATTLDQIVSRMEAALGLEIADGLDHIPPAPDQFFKMWETHSELFKHTSENYEMALA